jgi:deoxyribodipyrimidine photo-lyase
MLYIYIFSRDFRIIDNLAFNKMLQEFDREKDKLLPLFIFDKYQILNKKKNNSYKFMMESLFDLNYQLLEFFNINLYFINDFSIKNIKKLNPDKVCFNVDFSPLAYYKFKLLINNFDCIYEENDLLLNDIDYFLKPDLSSYIVFSSYLKNIENKNIKMKKPLKAPLKFTIKIPNLDLNKITKIKMENKFFGGRRNIRLFNELYEPKHRNFEPHTQMSKYLKFGCISIRELYAKFNEEYLLTNLHWRNFYFIFSRLRTIELYYMYNNSNIDIINFSRFKIVENKYYDHPIKFFKDIKWENNKTLYKKLWKDAQTGFPIIDASVNCLKKTGYISNRARILIAYFSIKILHIDPFHSKYGGQIEFSKYLIDCCYANNFNNWLWVLGEYFDNTGMRFSKKNTLSGRIYSLEKYDDEIEFINKWSSKKFVPEIVNIEERLKKWEILTKV